MIPVNDCTLENIEAQIINRDYNARLETQRGQPLVAFELRRQIIALGMRKVALEKERNKL